MHRAAKSRPVGPHGQGELQRPLSLRAHSHLAGRNLRESAGGTLTLVVEVAWEPRLRPMGLKQRMAEAMAVDETAIRSRSKIARRLSSRWPRPTPRRSSWSFP